MPRTTTDPRKNRMFRMTSAEYERLQKCADRLQTTKTDVLMRGLALIEAEIQKRQESANKNPA